MTVTENSFEIRDKSPRKGGDPFLRGPYGPYTAHEELMSRPVEKSPPFAGRKITPLGSSRPPAELSP